MITWGQPLGQGFPGLGTVVWVGAESGRSLGVLAWPSLLAHLLLQSFLTCRYTCKRTLVLNSKSNHKHLLSVRVCTTGHWPFVHTL